MPESPNLLNAYVQCIASYAIHLAKAAYGRFEDQGSAVIADSHSVSLWRNMVVPREPLTSNQWTLLIADANVFFGSSNWSVWNAFDFPHDEMGLLETMRNPIMARPSSTPVAVTQNDDPLRIVEVSDGTGVRLFERVRIQARLSHQQRPADKNGAIVLVKAGDDKIFGEEILSPNHRMWIGYIEQEPVSTAASFTAHGVNMIKGVSTLRQFRGQGLARRISAHAVNAVHAPSVLDADPGAEQLYRQLGFEGIGRMAFLTPSHD